MGPRVVPSAIVDSNRFRERSEDRNDDKDDRGSSASLEHESYDRQSAKGQNHNKSLLPQKNSADECDRRDAATSQKSFYFRHFLVHHIGKDLGPPCKQL